MCQPPTYTDPSGDTDTPQGLLKPPTECMNVPYKSNTDN